MIGNPWTGFARLLRVVNGGTGATTARGAAANLAVPYILAKSAVAVSGAADTNENTLATISIPASAMGANGIVRVWTTWSVTNNANVKTVRVKFGGTTITAASVASRLTAATYTAVANRNATNSQTSLGSADGANAYIGLGNSDIGLVTTAIDTTAAVDIEITCQKATGTDTMTLQGYYVELLSNGA